MQTLRQQAQHRGKAAWEDHRLKLAHAELSALQEVRAESGVKVALFSFPCSGRSIPWIMPRRSGICFCAFFRCAY